jgi:hypothetical protein
MNKKKIQIWECCGCDKGPCFHGGRNSRCVVMECDSGEAYWKDVDKYKITEIKSLGEIKSLAEPRQTPNCAICEWKTKDHHCEIKGYKELTKALNSVVFCSAQGCTSTQIVYNSPECQKLFKTEEPPTCEPSPQNIYSPFEDWIGSHIDDIEDGDSSWKFLFESGAKNEALKYGPLVDACSAIAKYMAMNRVSAFMPELIIMKEELEKLNQSN